MTTVTASTAEQLLVTKVQVPPLQRVLVARNQLLARLDEATQQRLTLLTAAAGSGKTTLLSTWAARQLAPIAWLTLEAADDEPLRFWSYCLAALSRACQGIGDDAAALLRWPAPLPLTNVLTVLLNRLVAIETTLVLVLDDFHHITNRPLHQSLIWLLAHAPPTLHLIVAARSVPPWPLARLRARASDRACHRRPTFWGH